MDQSVKTILPLLSERLSEALPLSVSRCLANKLPGLYQVAPSEKLLMILLEAQWFRAAFLFPYLADSESMIEWRGEVVNLASDGRHTTTQMSSDHFPEEGFGKASYFRNIQIVDDSNNLRAPKDVDTFTEQSNCYDIQIGNVGAEYWES
ncbi:hypothetical protein ACSBR2_017258 [Camellia fascicularis]